MKRFWVGLLVVMLFFPVVAAGAQSGPLVTLPKPGGPFAVGRVAYDWVDESRDEVFTDDPSDKRELMVYAWYPADATGDVTPAGWLDPATAEAVATLYGISPALINAVIGVHALDDAPLAAAETAFPVLIMSHGDGAHPMLYTSIAEELASQGYVVFGIAHTYNAVTVGFPDGRIAAQLPEASVSLFEFNADAPIFDQLEAIWDLSANTLQFTTADTLFVLDQVTALNESDPRFAGRLDLDRLGMFGHSLGGATTVEAMSRDTRIRAGAVLDGNLWNIYENGIDRPVLFLAEEAAPVHQTSDVSSELGIALVGLTEEQHQVLSDQWNAGHTAYIHSPTAYSVAIKGTEHLNFSDAGLLVPVLSDMDEDLGPIDPAYALEIVDAYLEAFFGQYLNGQPSDLLTGAVVYPEVTMEFHTP